MIAASPMLARDMIVSELRKSLSSTEHGLSTVPGLVTVIVRDDAWRERVIRATGERVEFDSFEQFVLARPLDGLGATLDQLRGVCRADPEAIDAIDRAIGSRQGERTDLGVIHPEVAPKQRDRSGKHLRRLRRDFPALHADVLGGGVTVYEASVKAGIFPKRVSVNLSSPESAARTLLSAAPPEFVRELGRMLTDGAER